MPQKEYITCLAGAADGNARQFTGFAPKTLLETGQIPIEEIADLALREGQRTNPLYRVHRWFARRLGSQVRSILTGLSLKANDNDCFWDTYMGLIPIAGAIVLDPFVGGGTSLLEAIRCNCCVIGYDIDPVAAFITRFELEAANCDVNDPTISYIISSISEQISPLHKTQILGQGEREVLHHFWVERRTCGKCGNKFEANPHYRLAYNKEKDLQWVFCKDCHSIYELPLQHTELFCKCGTTTEILKGTLIKGKLCCPDCSSIFSLADSGQESSELPGWYLFAQEFLEPASKGTIRRFKRATDDDRGRYEKASQIFRKIEMEEGSLAPNRAIPSNGRSDQRPIIHGIKRYRDLFNDRQLLHLTLLGKAIKKLPISRARQILTMAFSEHLTTNCMYSSYAFGYRRVSPLFSFHSYRHITRPAEINPWLNGIGRGTFPNALNKIKKAAEFAQFPYELDPRGGHRPSLNPGAGFAVIAKSPSSVISGLTQAAIITQSSENLSEIPDSSIDLILTDPPYFDNISYSELSDFYLAWHQSLSSAESPYDDPTKAGPISENLSLENRSDVALSIYHHKLLNIFLECHRVLKKRGLFVFSYHHNSIKAWHSIGDSLARSGFRCTAVVPLRGEGQGGLHSYKGTIKWDSVLICRKSILPARSENHEFVILSPKVIASAKQKANYYAQRFGNKERIGFREPDRLNFERALIAASAKIGLMSDSSITLQNALRMTKG
jgi:adenine-specific DNA methylase